MLYAPGANGDARRCLVRWLGWLVVATKVTKPSKDIAKIQKKQEKLSFWTIKFFIIIKNDDAGEGYECRKSVCLALDDGCKWCHSCSSVSVCVLSVPKSRSLGKAALSLTPLPLSRDPPFPNPTTPAEMSIKLHVSI